jgi:hypothetical protein
MATRGFRITLAAIVLGSPAQAVAQTVSIHGHVADVLGLPVSGVEILVAGDVATSRTRADGSFLLPAVESGMVTITARRIGFVSQTRTILVGAEPAEVRLTLRSLPHQLAAVRITAPARFAREDTRLISFNRRRASGGGGTFLTRIEIERTQAHTLSDLLRLMPGFQATRDRRNQMQVTARGNGSGCIMKLVLDGVPVQMVDNVVDLVVRLEDVEALELYRGASTAPLEYSSVDMRGSAACGVIVVWTRIR